MQIVIFSEIIIKEKNFSKNFLIDNFIAKYIYKNMNFGKKKVDQSKFLLFLWWPYLFAPKCNNYIYIIYWLKLFKYYIIIMQYI